MTEESGAQQTRPAGSERSRRRTWVLVAVGVVLVIQGAYAARPQPQPYPAFVLPGFDETASNGVSKSERVMVDVGFEDGETERIYPGELFGDFNYSSIPGTIDLVFDAEGSSNRAPQQDVVAWLRERMSALYPGRPVSSVTLCWQEQSLHLDSLREATSLCIKTTEVSL